MAKQKTWLDSLQAIAIIFIILSYITSKLTGGNSEWSAGNNMIMSLTTFAYPMLLMVSGVVLLSRDYELKSYYNFRFLRVVTPFLSWTALYLIYQYYQLAEAPKSLFAILKWVGNLFIEQSISEHLWFALLLIVLFAIAPILRKIIRTLTPVILYFLLAAWILLASISKDFSVSLSSWTDGYLAKAIYYFIYSGYMVLGYALYQLSYNSKNIRLSGWIIFAVTSIIAMSMSYYTYHKNGLMTDAYYHHFTLNSIVQSVAFFMAFKESNLKSAFLIKTQKIITEHWYGLYLSFVLIASLIVEHLISFQYTSTIIAVPALTLLTLIISLTLLFILRKLSFGRYLAG